jgi:uncharacterized protein YbjT (DUF2867 family)
VSRRAALAGASGLVGGFLLRRLLEDPATASVYAPTRAPLPPHPKLSNPRLEGAWTLPPVDEAYCSLGTTIKKAGSPEAFRAVDLDLVAAFAKAARAAGARRFGLVSAAGAHPGSRLLYSRVKGEAERAVSSGFESVVIARPSILLGPRAESRPAERLGISLALALRPLIPRRWRAVHADAVAASLLAAVRGGVPGTLVLENEILG